MLLIHQIQQPGTKAEVLTGIIKNKSNNPDFAADVNEWLSPECLRVEILAELNEYLHLRVGGPVCHGLRLPISLISSSGVQ